MKLLIIRKTGLYDVINLILYFLETLLQFFVNYQEKSETFLKIV